MTEQDTTKKQPAERYVAAIEISSSKIIGAVGVTRGRGDLTVLAIEQEKGVECVRYGRIQNVEEAYLRLQRIIDKLERRPSVSPRRITGVYVSLAGRSMRNISAHIDRRLPDDTEIGETLLADLRAEALRQSIDSSLEIVDAVPRTFRVNRTETKRPAGMIGNEIEATYDLIACSPVLRRNIERAVQDKLRLHINGFVVTPLALGHLILSDDERRLGCMLVDMGAETTTVSIYRNGNLHYLATLPLGSRNITKDITTLNVLEEHAEDIKLSSGNAIAAEHHSSINLNGIKLSDVSNLVVARAEEIVANINEQINYADMNDESLPGGIIAVGGGFKLNGMTELLERQSNLRVRLGRLPAYVDLEDTKAPSLESMEVVSVLYAGATLPEAASDVCLETPHREDLPATGEENPDEPELSDDNEKKSRRGGERQRQYGRVVDSARNWFKKMFDPGNEDTDNPEL